MAGAWSPNIFDDWSSTKLSLLYEAALRLLAALGSDNQFPDDGEDLELLLPGLGQVEIGEPMTFAVETPGKIPRYLGEDRLWISPAGEGRVRIRAEGSDGRSIHAVLSPDGRLTEIVTGMRSGSAESESTDQERSGLDSTNRFRQLADTRDPDVGQVKEKEGHRFRVEHLRGVSAAPWQETSGLVVTWIAFYETGVTLAHLTPRLEEVPGDPGEGGPGDGLRAMAMPSIHMVDDLGNEYEEIGLPWVGLSGRLFHAEREYAPAVPESATRLIVHSECGSVDVEVKQ